MRDQRKIDAEHLKLLVTFHFVVAGLAVVGIGFLFLHYFMFSTFLNNPRMWNGMKNNGPSPAEFFAMFRWFYLFFGILIVSFGVGNLASGLCIRARRYRMFSIVIAGLDCLQMPFGTILGIFTLVVLLRDSVREVYESRTSTPAGSSS